MLCSLRLPAYPLWESVSRVTGTERVAFCEPVGTGHFWVLQVLQGVGGPQTRADWRPEPMGRGFCRREPPGGGSAGGSRREGVLQVGADGRRVLPEPTGGGPQVRANGKGGSAGGSRLETGGGFYRWEPTGVLR